MNTFTLHTLETAPEASKPLLEASLKAFGMLPNLHAVMAEAPGMLEGYQRLHQLFADSSFNPEELTVVWQTINVEHDCHYCVPAHTGIAQKVMSNYTNHIAETPIDAAFEKFTWQK